MFSSWINSFYNNSQCRQYCIQTFKSSAIGIASSSQVLGAHWSIIFRNEFSEIGVNLFKGQPENWLSWAYGESWSISDKGLSRWSLIVWTLLLTKFHPQGQLLHVQCAVFHLNWVLSIELDAIPTPLFFLNAWMQYCLHWLLLSTIPSWLVNFH